MRKVHGIAKELIIPDSGDGNKAKQTPFRLALRKELIIPDSGDGNLADPRLGKAGKLKELIIPDSGDGNRLRLLYSSPRRRRN